VRSCGGGAVRPVGGARVIVNGSSKGAGEGFAEGRRSRGGDGFWLPFEKWEGLGNDYIYVDLAEVEAPGEVRARAASLSRVLSDRHFGVGGDGLVLIGEEGGLARMWMYNADGSLGSLCGNALRCVGKYLAEREPDRISRGLRVGTDSGVKTLSFEGREGRVEQVLAEMGEPIFESAAIPFLPGEDLEVLGGGGDRPYRVALELEGERREASVLSVGNPHLVVFLEEDPADLDLERWGPGLESARAFPDRANVEFVRVEEGGIRQRTYERGSGETLACGSGACAVAVAAVDRGFFGRGEAIPVRLRGGTLEIGWKEDGGLWMRGPARRVFEGRVWVDLLEEARGGDVDSSREGSA